MVNEAVSFTPKDLNRAWHELQRQGGRVTHDAIRRRAQEIRNQAIALEQTAAINMQDGGSVNSRLSIPYRPVPRDQMVIEPVHRRLPEEIVVTPTERQRIAQRLEAQIQLEEAGRTDPRFNREAVLAGLRGEEPTAPTAAPPQREVAVQDQLAPISLPASARRKSTSLRNLPEGPSKPEEPQEEGKRRRFTPWKKLKQMYRNYISHTELGASVQHQRLLNDYQQLANRAAELNLLTAEEARQREKILASVGERLIAEPVTARSALGQGTATRDDWEQYRRDIRSAVKNAGGDAQAVVEADRMVTEYQQSKFEELGRQAYAALAAGNAGGAQRLLVEAFQYMPTGTDMRLETRATPQGQQLVAIFTDEKSGKPVDAKVMTPEAILGYVERLSDPKAWLTRTTDMSAKERGQVLAAMDRELRAAQVQAQQTSAQAAVVRAQAELSRAAGSNAQQRGLMTPADFSKMIAEENKLRTESLDENVLPPIPLEDALAMRGLVEQIKAYQPSLSTATIGQLVVKGWGDPQLVQKLVAANLLPGQQGAGGP